MAEWLMALVLKTRDLETGPGVRIPLLPPTTLGCSVPEASTWNDNAWV